MPEPVDFSRVPRLASKLQENEIDPSLLRRTLFDIALEGGDLDSQLQWMYPDVDYEDQASLASPSDFPDYIPYQGADIDPDLEDLGVFRLAATDPEFRSFVEGSKDVEMPPLPEARQSFYELVRSRQLTPEQVRALRNAGSSRHLESEGYSRESIDRINSLLQDTYGNDVDYSRAIDRVADVIGDVDDVIRPVEREMLRNQQLRQQLQAYSNPSSSSSRIRDINTRQLTLSLPSDRPTVLEYYNSLPTELPENFADLTEQTGEIGRQFQTFREAGFTGEPTFPIEGSAALPNVRQFLADRGANPYEVDRLARERLVNSNSLYDLQRDLNANPNPNTQTSDINRAVNTSILNMRFPNVVEQTTGTMRIPGLVQALEESIDTRLKEVNKEAVSKLNEFVEKYPEVGPYLQSSLQTTRPSVERNLERLSPYVDTEQQISNPENRAKIYNTMLRDLGASKEFVQDIETGYKSGDTKRQQEVIAIINRLGFGPELEAASTQALSKRAPVVGGGTYIQDRETRDLERYIERRQRDFRQLSEELSQTGAQSARDKMLELTNPNLSPVQRIARFSFDPENNSAYLDPDGEYGIRFTRSSAGGGNFNIGDISPFLNTSDKVSKNVLKFFKDNPVTNVSTISFETDAPGWSDYSYTPKEIPAPVFSEMQKFMSANVLKDARPGTLLVNSPLSTQDIAEDLRNRGKDIDTSSMLRREETFRGVPSNRRAAAYRQVGFGPLTGGSQYAYINQEGNVVPIQPGPAAPSLRGEVSIPEASTANVYQSREPLTAKAYFSQDPTVAAARGGVELGRALRQTPSALLPGAADLIPTPEAIRTGYSQGPVAMAKQMGQEFVQSLPTSVAAAGALATPIGAPFAPGIGAGVVANAAARALNEVVRQETGEGIVPKLRQTIGTAPRTGVASPRRVAAAPLTQQIRPLSASQRAEMNRQANRNEAQRRLDLAKQRFNPRRGEFGLSELIFGR